VTYVTVFLDIPKPTLYRWLQQGDLPYEDYGGLTDRHITGRHPDDYCKREV
jgi:hypothetical protein